MIKRIHFVLAILTMWIVAGILELVNDTVWFSATLGMIIGVKLFVWAMEGNKDGK